MNYVILHRISQVTTEVTEGRDKRKLYFSVISNNNYLALEINNNDILNSSLSISN